MSDHREQQDRLAVEWHDPFAGAGQQRGIVFYPVTPRPGAVPADFTSFVTAELAPAVGSISERRFGYGPIYLLTEIGETILDPLGRIQRAAVAKQLEALSTRTLDHRYLDLT